MSDRYKKDRCSKEKCSRGAFEEAKVSVPVTFRAYCEHEEAKVECMDSYVVRDCHKTPGEPFAVSKFTIVQDLRVEIPMDFYGEAEVGEAFVEYASSEIAIATNNTLLQLLLNKFYK